MATKKQNCTRKAKNTLKAAMKARMNKRFKVVGSRKVTRKQQNQIIKGYVKACMKMKA